MIRDQVADELRLDPRDDKRDRLFFRDRPGSPRFPSASFARVQSDNDLPSQHPKEQDDTMNRTKVVLIQDDELENYPPCQGQSQRRDQCMLSNGHRGLCTSQDGRYWA